MKVLRGVEFHKHHKFYDAIRVKTVFGYSLLILMNQLLRKFKIFEDARRDDN